MSGAVMAISPGRERRVEDARLVRIESSLDDIKKTLQQLVRLEVNQSHISERQDRLEARISTVETALTGVQADQLVASTKREAEGTAARRQRKRLEPTERWYWGAGIAIASAVTWVADNVGLL